MMGKLLRALIIEDSEIDALLLMRQLRQAGYELQSERVETEETFRNALENAEWDVILSDYSLPHLNGAVALKILKDKKIDIPFIVISGTMGEEAAVQLMKAGAHDFFLKHNTVRLPNAIEREIREAKHRKEQEQADQALQTRARQQAAIAEFGQHALANIHSPTLLKEAVHILTTTFNADCVRVLELLADNHHLQIHADTDGQRGEIDLRVDSHVAYTLASAHPVIVTDVAAETRFVVSPAFVNCRSGVSVIIQGRERAFGILDAFNIRSRIFTQDDIYFLQSIANILANAIMNSQLLTAEIEARKQAEEADQLKTQFLAMISHELRTPLTSIKGFLSTLLATDVELDLPTQRDFIATADQEADNLTELISQLLDMSTISAGTFAIDPNDSSLIEVIQTAIARLPIHAAIQLDVGENLPLVFIDSRRIQQVLINLLGNALKFSPEGKPILIRVQGFDDFVEVDVQDEGPGIPPDARQLVFEPFRQAHTDTKKRGAGLGLPISRGIIEAHGGKLWIQDRPLPGTTMSFKLPVVH